MSRPCKPAAKGPSCAGRAASGSVPAAPQPLISRHRRSHRVGQTTFCALLDELRDNPTFVLSAHRDQASNHPQSMLTDLRPALSGIGHPGVSGVLFPAASGREIKQVLSTLGYRQVDELTTRQP